MVPSLVTILESELLGNLEERSREGEAIAGERNSCEIKHACMIGKVKEEVWPKGVLLLVNVDVDVVEDQKVR